MSKTASLQDFADGADTSAWATRVMGVGLCGEADYRKGWKSSGPAGQATRAEVATILMRLLESKAEKAETLEEP